LNRYLPHWDEKISRNYPTGRHTPPDDIGANFYPELGAYSSKDPQVIDRHMFEIRKARIGKIKTLLILILNVNYKFSML